jgi:sortase (surface protein transpeptidase)
MARGSGIRALAAAGAVAIALLLSACTSTDGPASPSSTASPAPFSAGGLQDPSAADSSPEASATVPQRIQIPSIGVDAALEDLALGDGGKLDAPVDYDLAGWYTDGVVPGQVGPAIIAGHVDSPTAPAVFARIGELTQGAEVIVTMSDASTLTFQVGGSMQSAKAEFPTAAVYSNVPTPELRLITCTGTFDSSTGHYLDNLIVFAQLRS